MFLTEVNTWDVVRKLVGFKLRAYMSVFTTLMVVQIIAILLSSGGTGMMGTSSGDLSITLSFYSGSLVIGFTMIWSFISAIIITTKAYRYDDFTFITNRTTSNLSNILFLLIGSIIGGTTALLSGILQRVILYFYVSSENFIYVSYSLSEIMIGLVATILYIFLTGSLGYLIGTLAQLNKIFVFLIPAVFFGVIFYQIRNGEEAKAIVDTVEFYAQETSLIFFTVKVIVSATLLFLGAWMMTNRMEVRQ